MASFGLGNKTTEEDLSCLLLAKQSHPSRKTQSHLFNTMRKAREKLSSILLKIYRGIKLSSLKNGIFKEL